MPHPHQRGPGERRQQFEALYAANCTAVLGYLLRRTANPHAAADVLAEVFLTAWRRLDDIPPGEQSRPWLYGVARRMLANHHRGERRREVLASRLRADLAASRLASATVAVPDEATAAAAAAFACLAEADRELLALVSWEGLDNGQIAVALGCSRNAVRVRMHRARQRFAAALGQVQAAPSAEAVPATNGDFA